MSFPLQGLTTHNTSISLNSNVNLSHYMPPSPNHLEPLLFLILIAYLAVQFIENLISFINLRHLAVHGAEVPHGFSGYIDAQDLEKMRDYTLARSRVDFAEAFVTICVTYLFLFCGILNWYNNWIISHNWPFVLSGALFFLFLAYADMLIKIPFNLFNTFHIEQKFGFNTQTLRLWFVDQIKTLILVTLLYSILLLCAFQLIRMAPNYWWFVLWLFLLLFSIFIIYISPYVIEPLFNKFTPITNTSLEEQIKRVMKQAGLSISRVFKMDASSRSRHSNAYFNGIGHVKRIILFDTLLENTTDEEIIAVLAHEAGHWKKKHLLKRLVVMETLALAGMFLIFKIVQSDMLATLFQLDHPALYVKLFLAGFLGSLLLFPFTPLTNMLSRRQEREADDFAVQLTNNPGALATSLIKLGRDNLSNLHPHPLYAAFHYSHPPLQERISKLLSLDKTRP